MIGPVSGTGRAMMASLQQQMAKGMPPDQAIAYVKSMAQDGVAPLVDLYAMMKQFQRLKEQQVQPPQNPPTVRDQIMAMSQQGVPQQGQGMAPQGMPQSPMEQGLGGMNAGPMENPGFAGGGIVAFADGGLNVPEIYGEGSLGQRDPGMLQKFGEAGSAEDLARMYALALSRKDFDTASRLEQFMTRVGISSSDINEIRRKTAEGVSAVSGATEAEEKEAARRQRKLKGFGVEEPPPQPEVAATQTAVPPAPPQGGPPPPARVIKKPAAAAAPKEMSLEDRIAEEQAPLIKRGLLTKEGKSTATEAYRNILKGEDERMKQYFGKQKSYSLAEAGFKMAQAASRPGATFLGALSEGGMSHAQAMQAMNKEIELTRRQMQQQNYLLDKADEADARGDVDKAIQLRAKHEDQMIDLQKHRERLLVDLKQIEVAGENAAETRALRKDITGATQQDKLIARMNDLRQNDTQRRVLEAKRLKADEDEIPAIEAAIKKRDSELWLQATGADLPGMQPEDVTRASNAVANLSNEDLIQRLRALGYSGGSPTR